MSLRWRHGIAKGRRKKVLSEDEKKYRNDENKVFTSTWNIIIFIFKEPNKEKKKEKKTTKKDSARVWVCLKFIHVNPNDLKNGVYFFHYKFNSILTDCLQPPQRNLFAAHANYREKTLNKETENLYNKFEALAVWCWLFFFFSFNRFDYHWPRSVFIEGKWTSNDMLNIFLFFFWFNQLPFAIIEYILRLANSLVPLSDWTWSHEWYFN